MPFASKQARKEYMRKYRQDNPKEKERAHKKYREKNPAVHFVAIDGEGWDRAKVRRPQDYVLLADSEGREVYNQKGIPTKDCLEFILAAPKRGVLVGYGLNYDINQWLKDVPPADVLRLFHGEEISWDGYTLRWMPGKMFVVNNRTVYDVLGYFQQKFLSALKDWKVGTPDELAVIEQMKEMRGTFTPQILAEMKDYNRLECKLLVELMNALKAALLTLEPPIKLNKWNGAATIAKHLMAREGVYHVTDNNGRDKSAAFNDAVLRAYFGGWFQLFKQGVFDTVYNYDINSAYPYAMLDCPTLDGSRAVYATEYSDHPYAIWHIKWDWNESGAFELHTHSVRPFPFRTPKGKVEYPNQGEGYYHASLVAEAKKWFDFEIVDGWLLYPANDKKPFDFINPIARKRLEYKKAKDARNKPLKLGLNSLYGSTIDGKGQGRFRSLYWAGFITAKTRAMILAAAMQNPSDVIAVATDGLMCRYPLELPQGEWLGEWESKVCTDCVMIQSGVYTYIDPDGQRIGRTRGIIASSVDWAEVKKLWLEENECMQYRAKRRAFIGIGTAMLRKKPSLWRQFIEEERLIKGVLSSGVQEWDVEGPKKPWIEIYPWPNSEGVSAPYKFLVRENDPDYAERTIASEQIDHCE